MTAAPLHAVRVAWVSTWAVRCGVADYSRRLVDAVAAADPALRLTVLCDTRSAPEGGAPEGGAIPARPVWELCAPMTGAELLTAVEAADPMVVVVQHQPGLFSWDALAGLITGALAPRVVVAVLHNTRHLLERDAAERARVVAALGQAARVLVHTVADLNQLKRLGLVGNVALLPHGAPPPRPAAHPRALGPGESPIIGCYGFFLPGKGIGPLIEAVALLRRDWPGATLRLVNAAYGTETGAAEIAACRALAARLDVPVEWHLGFLPNDESLTLLAGCDVVALPYQASKEASSAALRTAMSAGAPVAVTPLPLFDEAGDAVARLPGLDAASLAAGLGALLADAGARAGAQRRAAAWLAEHGWEVVGRRLAGMLHGLAQDARALHRPRPG